MPKSGLSGSVRGAPSNGRPYRDTPRKPHMSWWQSSGLFLVIRLQWCVRYPRF